MLENQPPDRWYRTPRLVPAMVAISAILMAAGYGVSGVWKGSLDNAIAIGFLFAAIVCCACVIWPYQRFIAQYSGALFIVCALGRAITIIFDVIQYSQYSTRVLRVTVGFVFASHMSAACLAFVAWDRVVIPYGKGLHRKRVVQGT